MATKDGARSSVTGKTIPLAWAAIAGLVLIVLAAGAGAWAASASSETTTISMGQYTSRTDDHLAWRPGYPQDDAPTCKEFASEQWVHEVDSPFTLDDLGALHTAQAGSWFSSRDSQNSNGVACEDPD